MLFRERIANTKVCNTSKLSADKEFWGSDPVHPTPDGYNAMAKFILRGFSSMLSITGSPGADGGGGGSGSGADEAPSGSKHPVADVCGGSVPKRPFWVDRSEDFVTRTEGNRRGGGYGDRGRGG
jgi:hypothetical protein